MRVDESDERRDGLPGARRHGDDDDLPYEAFVAGYSY